MLNIPYQIKNRKVNVRKRKEKSNELDEWVLNILEKRGAIQVVQKIQRATKIISKMNSMIDMFLLLQ